MNSDGLPVLSNLRLVSSMVGRIDEPILEITGTEIGIGNDGEPIITNIQIVKRRQIKREKLVEHALRILISNFKNVSFEEKDYCDDKIFKFYHSYYVNIKTKKIVHEFEINSKEERLNCIKIPQSYEVIYAGWSFSNPVDGFDAELGYKERN